MELRESIEFINKKLVSEFGLEFNGQPRWRVVFSKDVTEKRWTYFTDEGFELINPEVRELPKYNQWVDAKYVLERLIPVTGETDLTTKISYEPAWVFQDKKGNYLPPWFDGCKFIIESIYSNINSAGMHVKYKDPNATEETRQANIKKMEDDLFGNETETGDHLAYKTGIVNKYDKETEEVKGDESGS